MYKPDYSAAPSTGGTAKQTTNNKNSLGELSKFYVMNSDYEVFKCIYNKEDIAPGTNNAQNMPTTANNYTNGIYTGPADGYRWKYLYTMTTAQVMDFLSSDFMPVGTYAGPAVVDGAIDTLFIKDAGTGFFLLTRLALPHSMHLS